MQPLATGPLLGLAVSLLLPLPGGHQSALHGVLQSPGTKQVRQDREEQDRGQRTGDRTGQAGQEENLTL